MAGLFACCMVAHEAQSPLLMIEVYGASKLRGGDSHNKSDAYVKLLIDGTHYGQTKVVKNAGPHVEWHGKFSIERPSGVLRLEVWDQDPMSRDDFLGAAEISLEKLKLDQHARHGKNLELKTKKGDAAGVLKIVAYPALSKAEQKHGGHAWGYAKQGADWQNDSVLCVGDSRQSPIQFNLNNVGRDRFEKDFVHVDYTYFPPAYKLLNNGHTIEVATDIDSKTPMGYLHYKDHSYKVDSFHFHAPAEHTLGEHRPQLELHIKHMSTSSKDKTAAVLGVWFDEGTENHFLEDLIRCKNFPMAAHSKIMVYAEDDLKARDRFDLQHLVSPNAEILHYEGSLTTPPCSEIVEWFVLAKPLHASKRQIEFFKKLFHFEGSNGNYRVLQNTPSNLKNKNKVLMLKADVALNHKKSH